MSSPTQRSLKLLRDRGYRVAITEHWNSFLKIRQDMFGFVDLVAVGRGQVLFVQTTDGTNMSKRIDKIRENKHFNDIVTTSPTRVVVHGWRKLKTGWACRETEVLAGGVTAEYDREQGELL